MVKQSIYYHKCQPLVNKFLKNKKDKKEGYPSAVYLQKDNLPMRYDINALAEIT
jgi:menaquinone-dependent protoporphyrinogen IX oxidase